MSPVSLGVPEHARASWDEMHDQIAATGPTPCAGPHRDRWNGDAAEQRWAAAQCLDCPVMTLCAVYARDAAERLGVWGGRTSTERRPSLGTRRHTASQKEGAHPMTEHKEIACPECAGLHMHHLTFDHDPGCGLRAADDQTGVNDALRSAEQHGAFTRPATQTEVTLIGAVIAGDTADLDSLSILVRHNGIHQREVTARDPKTSARERII